MSFKKVDLHFGNGGYVHFNEDFLEEHKNDLEEFLDGEKMFQSLKFAKKMMMSQEIKSNNTIEGINDDLSVIDEVIKSKNTISNDEKSRIINLYHGYQYILTHKIIDKNHLRELYAILSEGLLIRYDREHMGDYYRTEPVFITSGYYTENEKFMGMDASRLDYFMDQFFEYVSSNNTNSQIDDFIKSQIMHFYFVYLHPYFDVNGRTSRTVAMWYLLNQRCYPYIIFNQAIAFARRKYIQNIVRGRTFLDLTHFLKYMLIQVHKELEKEFVINNIAENFSGKLSKEELQLIHYFLTMRGNLTVKDLATFYNDYNYKRRLNVILDEKIVPLMEKGIILKGSETAGYIDGNRHNFYLKLNPEEVDVQKKIKYLPLDKYM